MSLLKAVGIQKIAWIQSLAECIGTLTLRHLALLSSECGFESGTFYSAELNNWVYIQFTLKMTEFTLHSHSVQLSRGYTLHSTHWVCPELNVCHSWVVPRLLESWVLLQCPAGEKFFGGWIKSLRNQLFWSDNTKNFCGQFREILEGGVNPEFRGGCISSPGGGCKFWAPSVIYDVCMTPVPTCD